jgi:predicted lipoprotein with Yx(FWY)xxD motif
MPVVRSRRFLVLAAFAALAAVLAACGGAYASGGSAAGAASASAARKGAAVQLRQTAFGKVLVDARGRTLYLFTPDRGKKSVCYGSCAAAWPPLLVRGRPTGGTGVKASLLGVTMRKNGTHQVTYAGHPLYLFAGDRKAGQVNGQGLQSVWWVVSATGTKVTKKVSARQTASTTVALRQTSLGKVLVDARGLTLYLYTPDTGGSSTCYGQCAASWPPLLAKGKPAAGAGARGSLLGTTRRTDGTLQVTYAGHPLYTFASDAKAGDVNGEDVGGVWYAVSASGAKVEPGSQSGTTTDGYGKGGGY